LKASATALKSGLTRNDHGFLHDIMAMDLRNCEYYYAKSGDGKPLHSIAIPASAKRINP
jgi:hypothetical protein